MPSLSAIAGAVAMAYPIAEAIVRSSNAKEAANLRKELDQILAKFNLKISNLRKGLEQKGLDYQRLSEKLAYSTPGGSGDRLKRKLDRQYREDTDRITSEINTLQHQADQYAADRNAEISKVENKGVIKTITDGSLVRNIVKNIKGE